jgi:hypothetical protein
VVAVLGSWLKPDAPPGVKESLAEMQRRALELQSAAGDVEEAPDEFRALVLDLLDGPRRVG